MILRVLWKGSEHIIHAELGETILAALQRGGITAPDAPCGGNGKCKKCLVSVDDLGEVLACQTIVTGEHTVTIPEEHVGAVIATDGVSVDFPLSPADGLGAAVDIGSTTVVIHLYDRTNGVLLGTCSGVNRQRAFGADVISRIQYTIDRPDGLEHLTTAIRDQLREGMQQLCTQAGRKMEELTYVTIAGNTVMEHLYASLSPASIAVAPFTPLSLFGEDYKGADFGLPEGARVYLAPAEAGYVGGDITAGILASGVYRAQKTVLFLDVGTNGEMALGSASEGFLCCATAAGPAFEGAAISQGMSAQDGAISRVELVDGALQVSVLGETQAEGICGSGLVDALAVMLQLGAVDETGRLLSPDEAPEAARPYLVEGEDEVVSFRLTDQVAVNEKDVRQLQLAKAAIAAGIQTLLEECGKSEDDVEALYLAGGFGNYIRRESAAAIGLIPPSMLERIVGVGNSAGQGAVAVLLSEQARGELDQLPEKCRYVELSGHQGFSDNYIECMMFE